VGKSEFPYLNLRPPIFLRSRLVASVRAGVNGQPGDPDVRLSGNGLHDCDSVPEPTGVLLLGFPISFQHVLVGSMSWSQFSAKKLGPFSQKPMLRWNFCRQNLALVWVKNTNFCHLLCQKDIKIIKLVSDLFKTLLLKHTYAHKWNILCFEYMQSLTYRRRFKLTILCCGDPRDDHACLYQRIYAKSLGQSG
jgi:hypothetical protein